MMTMRLSKWAVWIVCLFSAMLLAGQTAQEKEDYAASLLVQADDAYAKGDHQKAIEAYLLVAQTTSSKLSLSRAHLGLSLCYFYLNETENAKKHILKVLEIEPQKEVSPLFHPQTYVDLFNEVRRENEERLSQVAAATPAEALPEPPKKSRAEPDQSAIPVVILEEKGGHFEIDVHYSDWSLDPAKGAFEDALTKKIANEIRDQVTDELRAKYGGDLSPSSYSRGLSLDSQGSNYGFELRYFPLGRRGSMSIGLSLEKTRLKVMVRGPVAQQYTDGSEAKVEGDAFVETSPWTANLSFRWDFVPSFRVTPYFVFGLGVGPLEGTAAYVYTGTYSRGNAQAGVSGEKVKSFDDLREEGEIDLDRFILVQLALGLKVRVYRGFALKAEVGFWDGLLFRGGLAVRF